MQVTVEVKNLKKGTLYLERVRDSVLVAVDSIFLGREEAVVLQADLDHPELFYILLDRNQTNDIDNRIINNDFFVVYCSDDDCGSSEELAYQLSDQGYLNIYLFKGGWKQWTENSLPSSKNL